MDKRIVDLLGTIHAEASFLLLAGKDYCGGDFVLEACAGCQCFFACESITRGNRLLADLRAETSAKGTDMNREVFETKCQLVLDWARAEVRHFAEFSSAAADIKKAQSFAKDIAEVEPYIKASFELAGAVKAMIGEYRIMFQLLDKKIPDWREKFPFEKTCHEAEDLVNKILS
ncbi:MAG TPA: hypothetical protein VLX68_06135 [Chitinivibrionales bacterium]|nr:hypothetical protein [Chitinivibrionales bacterium]